MPPNTPPRTSSRKSNNNGNGLVGDRRSSLMPIESFNPAADTQTYRDLLIFEERLKQNAARLVKRKKKYQTFLVLLCATISFFGYYVFLDPHEWQPLHYLNVTILLVTGTMLFLFFASGMYAERITAANKFVPQANRSLRNFNMYLNTRKVQNRSFFSYFRPSTSSTSPVQSTRKASPSPTPEEANMGQARRMAVQHQASARRLHIPAIPPTSNPRGELIFSSKVTPHFREGYERYRAAFERRRKEKLEERRWNGWRGWWFIGRGNSQGGGNPSGTAEKGGHNRHTSTTLVPIKGSTRSSKIRTRSGTNASLNSVAGSEASSRASSRASSPSFSPEKEKRVAVSGQTRGRREQESETEKRGRDRTPSVTALSDRRQSNAMQSPEASISENVVGGDDTDAVAPVPSSVANAVDDRTIPEATLREPEPNAEEETVEAALVSTSEQ